MEDTEEELAQQALALTKEVKAEVNEVKGEAKEEVNGGGKEAGSGIRGNRQAVRTTPCASPDANKSGCMRGNIRCSLTLAECKQKLLSGAAARLVTKPPWSLHFVGGMLLWPLVDLGCSWLVARALSKVKFTYADQQLA